MRSNKSILFAGMAALSLVFALPASAQRSGAIEVGSLAELDPWAVGAPPRGVGPLPRNLWRASDAATLGGLFDRLPASFNSPSANDLARQALLSPADAPLGDGAIAARKRFLAIARLGLADPLVTMISGSRDAKADPAVAAAAAQAELAQGRVTDACRRVNSIDLTVTPPPFVLQFRALCLAISGEAEAAALAMELAKTAGAGDAWLQSVIAMLGGSTPARPLTAKYDTALNTTASLAARLAPPGRTPLQGASSLALVALARNEQAPPAIRATAGARALKDGLISPDQAKAALRGAFGQVGAPNLATSLAEAEYASGAYGRAFAVEGALKAVSTHADFLAAARLFAPERAAFTPDPGNATSAPLFARAALAEGDYRAAQRWRDTVDATQADPAVLAVSDLSLSLWRRDESQVAIAAQRRIETAAPRGLGLVARDLKIISALGADIGTSAAAFVARTPPAPGRKPDAATTAQLAISADQGAIGEVALMAALILGDGAEQLDGDALANVIRALRRVGLEESARRVVVEALIAGQARPPKP
jgi:hypothetical protein